MALRVKTAWSLLQFFRIQGPPEKEMLSCISSFRFGFVASAFGNAAFLKMPWDTPPNRSGQSTNVSFNFTTAVFLSVVSMESIEE